MALHLPEHPKLNPMWLAVRVFTALALLVVVLLILEPEQTQPAADSPANPALVQGPVPVSSGEPVKDPNGEAERKAAPSTEPLLAVVSESFTGDLDAMRKRGLMRVLVSYNRTNFFLTGAADGELGVEARGFEHDLMEQYRKFLNRKASRKSRPLQFVYVPVPFDRLLDALNRGEGDVVAAGMTVTGEREAKAAFTRPYLSDVSEVLVSDAREKGPGSLDELAGRRVSVLRGSSYAEHLQQLSKQLEARGLNPIRIDQVNRHLQTEDLLELVSSGALQLTVADEHLARLWSGVLPNLRVHTDLEVNRGGQLAWAVRSDNPKLRSSLDAFVKSHRKGTLVGNILFKRFYQDHQWVNDPTSESERNKLKKLAGLFRRYADQYSFDWLLIAAQAFQESRLKHASRSHKGAVGIMQVRPSTAADKNVDIKDIGKLENNIHAGVKYLAFLRDRYFSTPEITPEDQVYFSLAAYNAGPGAIRKVRRRAAKMGLDRNRWFGQVELAALRYIGREPVRYVSNILKYSTVYKLSYDTKQRRDRERRNASHR